MSPPEVWGPAIWTLFHTLAEKVTDEAYPFIKIQLFGQIRKICGFLPCPECSADAIIFLAKVNIHDLKTKVDFRNTFYLFHNTVNAKKRKHLFNYSRITSYNNYGLVPVINNFISKYNTKGNMKLLAESFQRKLVLSEFKSWFTKTIRAFIPRQNIPLSISEITSKESVSVTEDSTITREDDAIDLSCGRQLVTEEAVTEEAVTEEVVVEEVALEAVTEEAVTEEVVVEEVVTEEVAVEAVTEEAVTEEVVTEEVVTEEVVTEEAAVEEVVIEEVVIE